MKYGDLIYDERAGLCAIVMAKSDSFPDISRSLKDKQLFYFYYTSGVVHEVWWHTYTDDAKERIKILNSMENT